MKILFISNLYPDADEPGRGIFNARRVKHLGELHEIRVVSPRPTPGIAPFWSPRPRRPRAEDAPFAPVFPPSAHIPKIGGRWNHRLMARSLRSVVEKIRAEFPFDAVLASWAFPDVAAVARLAAEMDFPFVAGVQGSDVHQYLEMPERRRVIVGALAGAAAVATPSRELARLLVGAGVDAAKVRTIYNGVERDVFFPGDKLAARCELGLPADGAVGLFVGNFLPVKNPLLAVDAFASSGAGRLVMVGDGVLLAALRRRAAELGVAEKVFFAGRKPPSEVARFMRAADWLCVPSENEGVPNVIYEAFACGLRVAATRVGGIPEILSENFLGQLVGRGDVAGLARAMRELSGTVSEADKITAHARQFDWRRNAEGYSELLAAAVSGFKRIK